MFQAACSLQSSGAVWTEASGLKSRAEGHSSFRFDWSADWTINFTNYFGHNWFLNFNSIHELVYLNLYVWYQSSHPETKVRTARHFDGCFEVIEGSQLVEWSPWAIPWSKWKRLYWGWGCQALFVMRLIEFGVLDLPHLVSASQEFEIHSNYWLLVLVMLGDLSQKAVVWTYFARSYWEGPESGAFNFG